MTAPPNIDALAESFSEKVAEKVAAKLAPQIAAAVAQAFTTRVEGKILDIPALARQLGKSTDALRMWLGKNRGGAALAARALDLGGGRKGFRAEDVDAFLSGKGGAR